VTSGDEARGGRWKELARFLRRVPRQARSRSVVSAILDAAEESLDVAEHGPLERLFVRAGVAAGSFYEYFASRDALLSAVVQQVTDRNFEHFLSEIDAKVAGEESFEGSVRIAADVIVRRYLRHPSQLRTLIRLIDRLGLVSVVARERDRFADAIAERIARFTPDMTEGERRTAMRAVADAVTGVVVLSAFRDPVPPVEDVVRAGGDAAWGVLEARRARTADR
jgi:AcrR family transcriptional regulator